MGRDLFGTHLAIHLTPEWRPQYLQYEAMVDILYASIDRAPCDTEMFRSHYSSRINKRFFSNCHKELRTELNYFIKQMELNG